MPLPPSLEIHRARKALYKTYVRRNDKLRHSFKSMPQGLKLSHASDEISREANNVPEQSQRTVSQCALLELPKELRDMIIEYALQEPTPVHITQPPPDWLLTCTTIRDEAWKQWYEVNHFGVYIRDLDARLFVRWYDHIRSLGVTPHIRVFIAASCHWDNLVRWSKAIWQGRTDRVSSLSNDPTGHVVSSAHAIACNHSPRPWQECKDALESMRNAIGVYQPEWLEP